jgi:hypothetical protein
MNRMEPPPLAAGMLEHRTPASRNGALAGDLLDALRFDALRSDRSSQWSRRQVLAACAVTGLDILRARLPLLLFALLWSVLAPAWTVLVDRIDASPQIAGTLRMYWPLDLAWWSALNAAFLWAGMALYLAAHVRLRKTLLTRRVGRSLLLAPALFLPAYAITAVLSNLLWFPGLAVHWRTLAPLAEIVDLRMWADVQRVPFLVALAGALCCAIPLPRRADQPRLAASAASAFSARSGPVARASASGDFADASTVGRFLALTVGAGLINAMIASFLLLRLPDAHAPSFASLCMRAALYVAVGGLAGVGGSWFYWNHSSSPLRGRPPLPFSLFALVCVSAWVWIPCMVLFTEQVSAAAAFVAMIGAFLLASGLRSATRAMFAPVSQAASLWEYNHAGLFAGALYRPSFDARGYGIALALYAAGWALATHSNYTAALLLALSAALFAWERTAQTDHPYDQPREYRRSALRLAGVLLPAMVLTIWALLDGVAHRDRALAAQTAALGANGHNAVRHNHAGGAGFSGYRSIILWPVPEKHKIIAPLPPGVSLMDKSTKRPLVLRFTGAYWYFQPPDSQPGPRALESHGTPLQANIHVNNLLPLLMEAHQNLSAPVRLPGCGVIQVAIENRDTASGPLAVAVLLTDSSAPGNPALYLGQQTVAGSQPGQPRAGSVPVEEELRFLIPAVANMRQFDAITVMFLPEMGSFRAAPQMAIDQFTLIPR